MKGELIERVDVEHSASWLDARCVMHRAAQLQPHMRVNSSIAARITSCWEEARFGAIMLKTRHYSVM